MNILLVEDNLATLLAVEKNLRTDGHTVHVAEGYQTALDLAHRKPIDVAICDIHLWDGNGCDLLRELQKVQPMKAIALTAYCLPEESDLYKEAGFGVVLRKPVRHSQIASAIALVSPAITPILPHTPV